VVDAVARKLERDPRSARVMCFEVIDAGPLVQDHRRRTIGKYAAIMESVMPPIHPDRGLDRGVVASALIAGLSGLALDWWAKRLNLTRDDLVEHAMLLVMGVVREAQDQPDMLV
jgi:hypothetical protein